jgi:hypothetical protein
MSRINIGVVGLAVLVAFLSFARAEDRPDKVQPVDFHKLQDLMPAKAVGVDRSSLTGENVSIGESSIAQASADYTKPDSDGSDPHASIMISDYVAAPQMVAGMTAWRTVPIRVENDQGYQRTAKLKDFPAFESYTKDGNSRQMMVLVAERFLVKVETTHVSEQAFKQFVESLPVEKLAKLK